MKPTARFWSFLAASIVFYFFANQTHIGWLYVVSALLGGIILAAWVLNRSSLKGIIGKRDLNSLSEDTLHEGDEVSITLIFSSKRQIPAAHLKLVERCPLASPESDEAKLSIFIPTLTQILHFEYVTIAYRRGLHHFPAIKMMSRAPFGFFTKQGESTVNTSLLVYPELRKLRNLSLLDRQLTAELTNPRAGMGSEVIGVRDYRAGDSLRHIHWRSVARHGQLISKEFAEETQPGVTVVLDRYCPIQAFPDTKHQPFEIAVKCAVTMTEYAMRLRYPVYLAADSENMAFPQGAIVWDALMQYMARVPANHKTHLADVLSYQPMQQFVAVAMAWPDETAIEALLALKQRGINLFVTVPEPASYPIDSEVKAANFVGALERAGITVRLIKHGDDWAEAINGQSQVRELEASP
jgi:uncharacterized protein (DUF58 family)